MVKTIELTSSQKEAYEFLGDKTLFKVLVGSAGTGKTTVISEYVQNRKDVLLTAPTHKAAQVMTRKSLRDAATIQSTLLMKKQLIGSKQEFVFDQGTFDRFGISKLEGISTIIIDEASMISTYLLDSIEYVANKYNIKFIFVGDSKQLNPVNEIVSPIFSRGYPQFDLTEIIRQAADNDIIWLSRNLDSLTKRVSGKNYTYVESHQVPYDLLIESEGTDKCKFVTWRNDIVSAVNLGVRKMIYGEKPEQVEIGETIMLKEMYADYKNNEEVLVERVGVSEHYYADSIVPHPIINTLNINADIIIPIEADQDKVKQNLNMLAEYAKYKRGTWAEFYRYKEFFADFQYNHAITVHRSQGSTYENSIINVKDIMANSNKQEMERMLYTAITRASQHNYLF